MRNGATVGAKESVRLSEMERAVFWCFDDERRQDGFLQGRERRTKRGPRNARVVDSES